MKTILLLVILFDPSLSLSGDDSIKKSLQSKLKSVKFDDFFTGFERMRPYYFNGSSCTFSPGNESGTCTGSDLVEFVFNWNDTIGLVRRYFRIPPMCVICYFYKDDLGFLRSGVDDKIPPELHVASFEELTGKRVYRFALTKFTFQEYWPVESNQSFGMVGDHGLQDCNLTWLNLNWRQQSVPENIVSANRSLEETFPLELLILLKKIISIALMIVFVVLFCWFYLRQRIKYGRT